MPFRLIKELRPEPLEQQGRGREPSPALTMQNRWAYVLEYWKRQNDFDVTGHGCSAGSYAVAMRQAFADWRKDKGIRYDDPITFEYRLSRRKIVTIAMINPRIMHKRKRGNGRKGFVLEGQILSIDGVRPTGRWQELALNRVVQVAELFPQLGVGRPVKESIRCLG
jgi:hypothetical protein